ncbi:MAG: diguanylate cyclase [Rickettsiales bacterium]|jgi:diguanylate cyclase (GGDEF)-like protein/PAS domain S-box-containing protein|nr:diguanylate cyclase [Rickettsiales bacterium]
MKKKLPHTLKGYARKAPDNAESYSKSVVDELRAEITLLTSYSNDVIYRLRYDTMQYDYISPSVVRLLGFSQEEMKKLSIRSLIAETRIVSNALKPIDSFTKLEEERKRGEVSKWQADYLMRTKDGRKIWVSDISYPWFDESGNIVGSVGSLRDISERVSAESEAKDEIARMASIDQLTGLSSRSIFFDRLEEELKRIKRNRDDLSILIIDIDHFRNINNNYGQQAGDKVLVGVAKIIESCLRETDTGSRIGGEEFGVILPETPAGGAYWVGERIRSSVAKQTFHLSEQNPMVGCTISVGIASARFDQHLDSETLYKTADKRLFIAKHTGRNQVSMDEIVEMH